MHKILVTVTLAECDRTGNQSGVTYSVSGSSLFDPITYETVEQATHQAFDGLIVGITGRAGLSRAAPVEFPGVVEDKEIRVVEGHEARDLHVAGIAEHTHSVDEVHGAAPVSSHETKEPVVSKPSGFPETIRPPGGNTAGDMSGAKAGPKVGG